MITLAIALGLVFGFALEQLTTVVAGGLVVPGYVAIYLDQPLRLLITVAVAGTAFVFSGILEKRIVLYGRRRAALVVLVAFALDWGLVALLATARAEEADALGAIGHIVPGILANTMVRNGLLQTLMGTFIVAVVVRLALLVILGGTL